MESYQQPEDDKHEFCRVEIKEEVFFDETEEQSSIDGIQEESGIINDIKEENVCFDPTNVQSITPDVVNEENVLLTRIKKEVVYDDTEFINKEETDYAWPEDAPREIDPLAVPGIKYENEFGNTERGETVASGSRSITGFESLWFKEHDFGCELDDEEKPNNVSTTSNLEQHKGLHKCNVCEYACSTLGDLKTHRKKHLGEKPYKCNVCEYASSMSGNLNRHMKRHTGEQPYKCSLCEYTSSHSGNLDKHMRSHRGERTNGTNVGEYGRFYRKVETKAKSRAYNQREYRKRKKMEKQLQSPKKLPKTNAERQRKFRQNKKIKKQQSETFTLARLSTKLEMENGKLVVKQEWDKAALQIADNHLPPTERSDAIQSQRESSKTRGLPENEEILRKRQLARERIRRYREKKQASMDLTTDEEILRKKEAARKYRENQRLKRSNIIQDSLFAAPIQLPDNESLVKQLAQVWSMMPIDSDIGFEPNCNLFTESTTVNREIVLPDQTNLTARDVVQDETILCKRESKWERVRKYREKMAESKDLIGDKEILCKKESAKKRINRTHQEEYIRRKKIAKTNAERQRKFRQNKKIKQQSEKNKTFNLARLATKLEMENGKLVVKRKWDDQEKAVLQIADNHLPATESSEVIKSRRESSKTRDLTEDEKILRKRQLASERLRRFYEKKQVSKDLATTVEEILHKIEATENEKLLRKRQLARERLRRFREKKKQASKDLTTDEEILRKKEAARKRSRKYRENQRLKRSNVIQDSQFTAPSRLPDDNSLVKQPTIHDSQDSGSSRTPIEKDISFEPICNLFIDSTTVNREIVLPDQTNLLARDVAQDEKILHKRESERERIRKYREKKAESKDLISDEEISHKKESAKEWSRKYRQKKRLQQLNFNVIHNSQIAGPSLLHDDQSYGKQATDHNSLGGISRTECAPSHLDDSFEPVI